MHNKTMYIGRTVPYSCNQFFYMGDRTEIIYNDKLIQIDNYMNKKYSLYISSTNSFCVTSFLNKFDTVIDAVNFVANMYKVGIIKFT